MDPATLPIRCPNRLQYALLLFLVASGLALIVGILGEIELAQGGFDTIGGSICGALPAALLIGFVDAFGAVLPPQAAGVLVYVPTALIPLRQPDSLLRAGCALVKT